MRTALALATLLLAAPAAAETKIGYVDFQRALNEVDEGKVAQGTLKKDFEEKQKQLDKDKTDLDRMQAEFEKQAAVLSEEARRDRAIEIQKRMAEAQGKLLGFQKELAERERLATRAIFDKMVAITREIADAEGVGIVFEKNDAGIVVAPASLDLTNELVRKYNARHRPGDAPAGDKKAAAPSAKKKAEPKKADGAK
ncbi:MAG: OmpH family outer membrane protein [Deltaproteobacteria bacterium]|nr:OmpH family outer membrane protein [Deltaproteobacteria bacterium]